MTLFNNHFVSLECPGCGYAMDVQFLSVRLEETIFCSCCKLSVRLQDGGASAHRAQRDIEEAMNDLERELGNLNQTFTMRI